MTGLTAATTPSTASGGAPSCLINGLVTILPL
jgi:hypothetical protein